MHFAVITIQLLCLNFQFHSSKVHTGDEKRKTLQKLMTFQISLHVTLKKYLSSLLSFFQFLLMKNFLFVMKIDREQSIFRQQGTEDSPFIEATTLLALPKATKQTIYHDLGEPCKKRTTFPFLLSCCGVYTLVKALQDAVWSWLWQPSASTTLKAAE